MWKVMDKLNKLAQIADKGWRPILRVGKGANIQGAAEITPSF